MKDTFSKLFNQLSAIADELGSTPEEELQHRFLIYMGLFMSFGGILWGTISAYSGLYSVSLAPYGFTVITVCNFIFLYYTKKFPVARFIQLSISLLVPFIFQWSLGGFVASGGMMLWALLGILGAFTLQHRRYAIFWLVVYLVLTIFSGFIDKQVQLYGIDVPSEITTLFFTLNIGFISTFIFFLVYYFISSAEVAQKSLEDSHLLLEQRVIERTQELQGSLQKINDKNHELETLSSKLSKYLSKQIYDSIFSGQQDVKIESYRKKLTVFFSDIKDFTKLTESLESESMTELLNHYLNEMAEIALQYGGTIDKFIGDSIMIFFGDPETKGQKGDALACVQMAYEMRERMKALQSEWERQGVLKPLRIRIGINTGFCTVGNFGSEDRLDYTIIGQSFGIKRSA